MNNSILKQEELRNDVITCTDWQIEAMDEEDYNNFVSMHPDERSISVSDEICADEIIYTNDHPSGVWYEPLRKVFYEVRPLI